MRKIKQVIIHCSDTPNGKDYDSQDIHLWHTLPPFNFRKIGYHYVITIDGETQDGRREYETGAHTSGHNEDSIGICLIGKDVFNDFQFNALACLILKLKLRYDIKKIVGHNYYNKNKTCPNFNVGKFLKEYEWLILRQKSKSQKNYQKFWTWLKRLFL